MSMRNQNHVRPTPGASGSSVQTIESRNIDQAAKRATWSSAIKLLSTRQVSEILDTPESTLRYWRCAGLGPSYVKLGGRIKYDEADVHAYVKANRRIPSVRVHGGIDDGFTKAG